VPDRHGTAHHSPESDTPKRRPAQQLEEDGVLMAEARFWQASLDREQAYHAEQVRQATATFRPVELCIDSPRIMHEGSTGVTEVRFTTPERTGEFRLSIHPDARTLLHWTHYYTDAELDALRDLFHWGLDFGLGRATAVAVPFNRDVHVQPIYKYRSEWTICFCYDEVRPLYYVYWLVGVARRDLTRAEYDRRVAKMDQWASPR
jgi:hypothetical protein